MPPPLDYFKRKDKEFSRRSTLIINNTDFKCNLPASTINYWLNNPECLPFDIPFGISRLTAVYENIDKPDMYWTITKTYYVTNVRNTWLTGSY